MNLVPSVPYKGRGAGGRGRGGEERKRERERKRGGKRGHNNEHYTGKKSGAMSLKN